MCLPLPPPHYFGTRARLLDNDFVTPLRLKPTGHDYLPADLKPLIREAGVNRTILVQTQHDTRENDWALSLAHENDFIARVVALLDLASPNVERQLEELRRHPKVFGLLHLTQDEPN